MKIKFLGMIWDFTPILLLTCFIFDMVLLAFPFMLEDMLKEGGKETQIGLLCLWFFTSLTTARYRWKKVGGIL